MEPSIGNKVIDDVLDYFYKIYPEKGCIENCSIKLNKKEVADLQSILTFNGFLESLGRKGYYFYYQLTPKGKQLKDNRLSFKDYDVKIEKEKKEEDRFNSLNIEKIEYETKLAKLKFKTFWWIFFIGVFGGVYSVYSIIEKATQERIDDKINRIVDRKFKNNTYTKADTLGFDTTNQINKKKS